MSERDIETIRRLNAAFNEAPDDTEAWLAFYHPDQEFHAPPEWPERSIYRGHEGIAELAEAWFGSFDEYRWDEEEIIDAGDSVVALFHHRGRMGSEWFERQIGCVFHLRGDKVIRVNAFFDWHQALDAAGLRQRAAGD
jgi:ketosteroid isomerase-like protein